MAKTSKSKKVEEKRDEAEDQNPLLKELADLKDSYLRTAAEYENYKKRTQKEQQQLSEYVKANTIKALIPSVDNIERALSEDPTGEDYAKGVQMTLKGITDALSNMGLSEINPINENFDPGEHEAVMHIEDTEYGENTVVEVFQKGYKIGETILRHAMVKVAN